ncbi:MAG: PDZ domain-containing protein [Planctomycetales bacterium]|nr:PDZ domain-containing protein [Planctomycetales bacterium]
MTIHKYRLFIFLANVGTVVGIVGMGGLLFVKAVLGGAPAVRPIPIPREKVKTRQDERPVFDKYAAAWNLPITPADHRPKPAAPIDVTPKAGESLEKVMAELRQAFNLLGTMPMPNSPLGSLAILEVLRGKSSRVVKIGETVEGFRVVKISDVEVLFDVRGLEAPLKFSARGPNSLDPANARGGGRDAAKRGLGGDEVLGPSGDQPFVARAKAVSETVWEVTAEERQFVLEHAYELSREVKLVPAVDKKSGKIEGLQIQALAPNSLAAKRGFLEGDVLLEVQGEPVTDPGKQTELIQKHRNAKEITIKFRRRGEVKTMTFKIR